MPDLYDWFDWLEMTWIGVAIRDSLWLFPAIEAVHLLGLALLGGSVLLLDLRLLGLGLREQRVAALARMLVPWQVAALVVLVSTGVPLFLSEAIKCYYSPAFWWKMAALSVAVVFTFGVRNRLAKAERPPGPWTGRAIGTASMALWLTVAAAGRWIGFS